MIRKLNRADWELFSRMVQNFYRTPAVLHPLPESHIQTTFDAAMSESPYVRVYILEQDGAIAGYAQVSLTYSNEAGGLTVWLEELYVDDAFRGCGLGSEFLRFLPMEFPQAKRFRLEVTESNADAVRLYTRFGYEPLEYRQMVLPVVDKS